jgi:dipeptidyl-peptidase-4
MFIRRNRALQLFAVLVLRMIPPSLAMGSIQSSSNSNRGLQTSYLPNEQKLAATSNPISFQDIGQFPGRACVGRMGAPTQPCFSPNTNSNKESGSVIFLQSSAGTASLTQKLWTMDLATGIKTELAKPPDGVGEEESMSAEEKLRRERTRQLHTGITSFAFASGTTEVLLCPIGNDLFILPTLGAPLYKLVDSHALGLPGPVLDPHISSDGSLVVFCCDKELYAVPVGAAGATPMQLTHDARGTACTNGLSDFIAMEEMDRYQGFWISPSNNNGDSSSSPHPYVAFEQSDESHIDKFRIMHSGQADPFMQEDHHYPFAGDANPKVRLGIVQVTNVENVEGQKEKVTWLDIAAPFGQDMYLARVQWANKNQLHVQVMNREQTELVLLQFDMSDVSSAESSSAMLVGKELLRESQPSAWINLHDMLVPLKEGGFIWASERTGYRHLYRYDANANLVATLTKGEWMVESTSAAMIDEQAGLIYFTGTKDSPKECHLYVTSLNGDGDIRRVTSAGGMHSILGIEKKKGCFIDSWSSLTEPFRVAVCSLKDGSVIRELYNGAGEEKVKSLQLAPPEWFSITADDDKTELHGAIYKPDVAIHGPGPYPAIVSVYGGPHAQMVADSWTLTADLRAQRLRSQGYLVLKLDNRGAGRRGLAFEAALRHDMGNVEVRDQVHAVRHWTEKGLVKADSVGIYGWSYGGYMSGMCLAKRPDIFKVAVAGAMVSSWDGYDTCYTERYMSTPQLNPDGYARSAVMPYVEQIEGSLLIVHGLMDENVHFRHSARLISALIKAQKHYELLLFPDERHVPRGLADKVFMEQRIASFFERCL